MLRNSISRIKLIRGLGFPGVPTRIKFYLKTVGLERELFTLNLLKGHEVKIPITLDQSHLPASFRFYDSILLMASEKISKQRKEFSAFQDSVKARGQNLKSASAVAGVSNLNISLDKSVNYTVNQKNKFNFMDSNRLMQV